MRMRKSVCELHLLKGELIYTLQMDHSPQNMCNEPTVVVKDAVIIDIHTITDTTIKRNIILNVTCSYAYECLQLQQKSQKPASSVCSRKTRISQRINTRIY
eukprot:m.199020 g.199020  ORF g.199020 m.199020 type:complete len:101 (+) comp15722_c1_seq8:3206-3508(+)